MLSGHQGKVEISVEMLRARSNPIHLACGTACVGLIFQDVGFVVKCSRRPRRVSLGILRGTASMLCRRE